MKDNNYLFAVASVRAKENSLLSQSDLEQLINAQSYKRASALLAEKGYDINEKSDYSAVLDEELKEVWNSIHEAADKADALNAFIVKNDFQNLKAILKAEVMNYDAKSYLVQPSVINPDKLFEAVSKRDFSSLPDFIGETAKEALEQITKTGNAQLCDALIDRKTLETILAFSKNSGDELLTEYANSYCLAADIKTAYRAIKTKKSSVFLNTAIAENDLINKESFIEAALSGEEEFFEYLSSAGFSDYKDALSESSSAFEKYCDDKLLTLIKKAKMTAFGLSPLAAYFVAKETEIKCLRIILSAKQSHISSDIIRERMREVYV
ncbi:MAG: V-type ATPase subunit [Eubacterium sp.]|nr:V-type ATPase subunit [Eubacterium sp.]